VEELEAIKIKSSEKVNILKEFEPLDEGECRSIDVSPLVENHRKEKSKLTKLFNNETADSLEGDNKPLQEKKVERVLNLDDFPDIEQNDNSGSVYQSNFPFVNGLGDKSKVSGCKNKKK
jgi:hypothetical protein